MDFFKPQVEEEEKPNVFPFLKDEGDDDWVLDQADEVVVAPTKTQAVPKAQQIPQNDRLLARLVFLVQFPNVDFN